MKIILKLVLLFKQQPLVIILKEDLIITNLLLTITKSWFLNKNNFLNLFYFFKKAPIIVGGSSFSLAEIKFLLKKSFQPILIINTSDFNKDLLQNFPKVGYLVTNYETANLIKKEKNDSLPIYDVGLNNNSDFWMSNINIEKEFNFKINYEGDTIPFWLNKEIYQGKEIEVLLAIRTGLILGHNLVEMGQSCLKKLA